MKDDQQGFCIQDPNISVYYNSVQPTDEINHPPKYLLTEIRKKKSIAYLRNYDKKYIKILQQNEFINHKLRQKWMNQICDKYNQPSIYNNFKNEEYIDTAENIQFDSNFQAGNLDLVFQVSHRSYQLYMRPDTNTLGHFQWFYFKIRNVQKDKTIKLKIMNFNKKNMLYNTGLKPYFFSKLNRTCWQQINQKVVYKQQQNEKYSLSFSYRFQFENDQISFASQPPYTYSMLSKFLESHNQDKLKYLGNSFLGFKIPKIQIFPALNKINSIAIAIARQHPGQAVGSWMMQGFIENLMKKNKLNRNIYWIIIPMVNPDGVFLGNNRTGAVGYDLNRCWNLQQVYGLNRDKLLPQIIYINQLVKYLRYKFGKKIKLFLDFHGHSGKEGIFSYGPPYFSQDNEKFAESRLFPQLIASKSSLFQLSKCGYKIPKSKKNAARAIFFQKYQIPFCYTIQSTFGLSKGKPLKIDQFIDIGKQISEAALKFLNYITNKNKSQSEQFEQIKILLQKIKTNYNATQCSQSEGEDSNSDNQISELQTKENFREKILQNIGLQQQKIKSKQKASNNLKSRSITFQKLLTYNSNSNHKNEVNSTFKRLVTLGPCHQDRQKKRQFRYFKYRREQQSKLFIKPISIITPKLMKQKQQLFSYPQKCQSELQKMIILSHDNCRQFIYKESEKKKKQQIKKREYKITKKSEFLLNYLSKNKNNKIGSKMLIINEL